MVTAPNAAVPAGLRRALDSVEGATSHAAGIVFVAPDGDILLCRRSPDEKNFGGHWALPGGGGEPGESPEQTANREATEELGTKPGRLKPLDRRITRTGTAFHTFAQPVADKFQPRLNGEHVGYAWAPLDQLPRPLHPGVEATLRDRVGMADDMTPEDWAGLRDGFLKWTAEEESEIKHASDMALDRDSVRSKDTDGRLHIAMTNISKATVNPYRGREIPDWEKLGLDPERIYNLLRPADELEKAAPTFNGIQVLRKHIPVNAEDHQPWDVIGATGNDARFEQPYLQNSMVIWSADDIQDVEDESKKELSSAYRYRAEMTPGNFDGNAYDGVMRDIIGNHVALVKNGRAGPDVVVGDSRENLMATKSTKFAASALRMTARSIVPLLAMDAKLPNLLPVFADVTTKNFSERKPRIVELIKTAKLAKDASLDGVIELIDRLEGSKKTGDDDQIDETGAEEMAANAEGKNLGMPPAETTMDAEHGELKEFLKGKGMGEDDINAACGMIKKPGMDAFPDKKDDETPEAKKAREEKEKSAKDAADPEALKKAEADKAKDAAMKDMVTKPAMDSAIKTAVEQTAKQVRTTERDIRSAMSNVRPWVGELDPSLAMDSAEDVYRAAAEMVGVPGAKDVHGSALWPMIQLMPKAGAKDTQPAGRFAMDSAGVKSFNERFPGAERIGTA